MVERLIVGAMSGTSADGVDVAITAISGRGRQMRARLVVHHHLDYPAVVRDAIFQIRVHGHTSLRSLTDLARQISLVYAAAVGQTLAKANLTSQSILAVAAHGQTLFHDAPLTLQWLDPALLAWETGCQVISDFRRADCAAGGQGAPLVPFADYILFRDPQVDRILLNIGGIANLSWLPAGAEPNKVIAYDCGPGNCLSDWICRTFRPSGPGYDIGGSAALKGTVRDDLAQQFLSEAYFKLPPPKSTDGPAMISAFERAAKNSSVSVEDLLATAAHVTATTIADAVRRVVGSINRSVELLSSGGGVHNQALMTKLKAMLGSSIQFRSIDNFGISPEAKEAVAFAILGAATLDSEPGNLPSVTGASRPVVLGSITPRP